MADKCEAYRALIEEAAGGGAGRALGAHLEACAACREFRREREALLGLLGGLGRVSAPDDFEFRLRARMASRGHARPWPLRRLRLAPALTAAAVAACLLAAVAVSLRTNPPGAPAVAVREAAPAPVPAVVPAPAVGPGVVVETPVRAAVRNAPTLVARHRVSEAARGRALAEAAEGAWKRGPDRVRRDVREDNFGVRAAAVIEGGAESAGLQVGARGVALRTSPETLRVVLRDERGASHVLPMRSVSFGAQAPVVRGPRAGRASFEDKEGVW